MCGYLLPIKLDTRKSLLKNHPGSVCLSFMMDRKTIPGYLLRTTESSEKCVFSGPCQGDHICFQFISKWVQEISPKTQAARAPVSHQNNREVNFPNLQGCRASGRECPACLPNLCKKIVWIYTTWKFSVGMFSTCAVVDHIKRVPGFCLLRAIVP